MVEEEEERGGEQVRWREGGRDSTEPVHCIFTNVVVKSLILHRKANECEYFYGSYILPEIKALSR